MVNWHVSRVSDLLALTPIAFSECSHLLCVYQHKGIVSSYNWNVHHTLIDLHLCAIFIWMWCDVKNKYLTFRGDSWHEYSLSLTKMYGRVFQPA